LQFLRSRFRKLEARGEGKQGDVPRLLDGQAKAALVPRADARQTARNNLAALSDKALQQANVTVGDCVDLLGTELANLLAPEELATAGATTGSAGGTWGARAARTTGAGCWCVLLRLRAGYFVSHYVSSLVRCAFARSRHALESLNIRFAFNRMEAGYGDRGTLRDAALAGIANSLAKA
jgi:hypothetical protein